MLYIAIMHWDRAYKLANRDCCDEVGDPYRRYQLLTQNLNVIEILSHVDTQQTLIAFMYLDGHEFWF